MLLPLDDLLAVTREFLHEGVSRSGLARSLRRQGVSDLRALPPRAEKRQNGLQTCYWPPNLTHLRPTILTWPRVGVRAARPLESRHVRLPGTPIVEGMGHDSPDQSAVRRGAGQFTARHRGAVGISRHTVRKYLAMTAAAIAADQGQRERTQRLDTHRDSIPRPDAR